jgi:hypothetical protein
MKPTKNKPGKRVPTVAKSATVEPMAIAIPGGWNGSKGYFLNQNDLPRIVETMATAWGTVPCGATAQERMHILLRAIGIEVESK